MTKLAIRTAIALLAAATTILGCARGPAPPERHPLIVIGVDGAEWAVIEELWRQDRLPTLRSLAQNGSRAVLKTSWASSPLIWSTVATGAVPSVHGITGFVVPTEQGDVPVSSILRRVPALWNMLTSIGRRTMVVGWWATWPAEEIDGIVISDRILDDLDQTFSPATFAAEVERGVRESASAETPFTGIGVGERRDSTMAWFAERLAWEDFDLLLAYFRTTDLASHYYWHWFESPDAQPGEDPAEAADNRERIFRAYEAVDSTIAGILAAAGRPVNTIVLSDHGFRASHRENVKVALDLDVVLERLGYLVRDEHGGVDIARSSIYTYGSGHTQPNKRVRFGSPVARAGAGGEPQGDARAALARDLARLTWSGGAPAALLLVPADRHAAQGVDLIVQIQTSSAQEPLLLDGKPLEGAVLSIHRITGGHGATTDGVLIAAGPDIAKGAVLEGIHVRDMAPTFLYGLDAPVARDFAGIPWRELYTSEFRSRHPLRAIESWGTREHGAATRSAADEKLLEELRALGYLD